MAGVELDLEGSSIPDMEGCAEVEDGSIDSAMMPDRLLSLLPKDLL